MNTITIIWIHEGTPQSITCYYWDAETISKLLRDLIGSEWEHHYSQIEMVYYECNSFLEYYIHESTIKIVHIVE